MAFVATRIARSMSKPKALFLNSARLNYDKRLDYSRLGQLTDLVCNEVDAVTGKQAIVDLVRQHEPEIVITKEMQVPPSALEEFPASVKLLCEAGTGYNNVPIDLARARGRAGPRGGKPRPLGGWGS